MTIAEIVAKIRTAVYGRDVRENIAKGIETINDNVVNFDTALDGRIDTLTDNINVSIEAANTKINNLDTTLSNKINNLTLSVNDSVADLGVEDARLDKRITDREAAIIANVNAKDDTIKESVTALSDVVTSAKNDLDHAEIDITNNHNAFLALRLPVTGTNLLKGTEVFDKAYWNIGDNVSVIDDIMGKLKGTRATLNNSCATQKYTFVQGVAYILSAWVRTDKQHGITVRAFNALGEDTAASLAIQGEYNGNGFGGWWKYEWKFTATASHAGEKQVGIYSTDTDGGLGTTYKLDVCAMQLQWGQEATPYMPSLKADAEQQPWQNMVLEGGWTNRQGLTPAQYYKDSLGRVHLRGILEVGTASDLFTLPVGYRPDYTLYGQQPAQNLSWTNVTRDVWVNNLGKIGVDISDLRVLHLEGISFRAEQ